MACRFMDGFDHYATGSITEKWTSLVGTPSISAGYGRRGGQSLRFTSNGQSVSKTFDAQATWTHGFAFRASTFAAGNAPLLQIKDGSSIQVDLRVSPTGTLIVTRNGSAVTGGTSINALNMSTYYYIEHQVTIASSIAAGTWTVKVNGVTWITVATGQSSKATANTTADNFTIGCPTGWGTNFGAVDYDDLYVLDGNDSGISGNPCNTFLGDVAVVPLYATGAGNNTTWTPDSGSNYARVNELVADGDSSWVETGGAGNIDSYVFQSVTGSPASIFAVGWNAESRKTDVSTFNIRRYFRDAGGNDRVGTVDYSLPATYTIVQEILHAVPGTSTAWTYSDLTAPEFGVKLQSVV